MTRPRSGSPPAASRCSAEAGPRRGGRAGPADPASARRVGLRLRGFGFDGAATTSASARTQLRTQLQGGKSLADVAKAQNKDVAGLKAALKAALTKQLDQAVNDGHLTAAQRTKILAEVDERARRRHQRHAARRPDGPKFRWR